VKRPALLPYLLMLQACLLFTLMVELTQYLARFCYWQATAVARAGLVLVFVWLYARRAGLRGWNWRSRTLWMRSVAGSLSMVCTFYALSRLPASDVVTLTNMMPIWVALLSWPVLGEAPSAGVWVAVASGIAGVVLIHQPHVGAQPLAIAAAAAASLFSAVAMLGLHRLRGMDPRAVVIHFSAVATLFCAASFFLFARREPPQQAPYPWLVPVLLLGVGLTASMGQLFLTRAFASGEPSRVGVVGLMQIVFTLALDVALFQHAVRPAGLVGIALVTAPTAWVMLTFHPAPPDPLSAE
jgi:drug/metabolite transporter (DMT)-like permease